VSDREGRPDTDVEIVELKGEIEHATITQARHALARALDTGVSHLAVDLTDVTFMDSEGLGLLVAVHKELRGRGGGLVITQASVPVRRVIEITGLTPLFSLPD
jgi:anti-sigma B factor antagonist